MSKTIKSHFNVWGCFYNDRGFEGRRYLDLIEKGSGLSKPDLMVVMMNPGSSKLKDKFKGLGYVEAEPDLTQSYIMKLMLHKGYKFARVLNLSDIRQKDSESFYYEMGKLDALNIPHSIFDKENENYFKNLFQEQVPVILAWGVSDALSELINMADSFIKNKNVYGIAKTEGSNKYYHPLMRAEKGKGWVELMKNKMKKSK